MHVGGFDAIKLLREMIGTENGRTTLEPYLARLTPRERRVIELRIGLTEKGCLTFEQAGEVVGVSKSRIYQNERKAVRKMRKWSRGALFDTDSPAMPNLTPVEQLIATLESAPNDVNLKPHLQKLKTQRK